MIFLGVIAWLICAIITAGFVMHVCEWDNDEAWYALLMSIIAWPLYAVFAIARYILMRIGLLAICIKGFLDEMSKENGND